MNNLFALIPLLPRIQKAIQTAERLQADPDVQDAIAVAEEVARIVAPPPPPKS